MTVGADQGKVLQTGLVSFRQLRHWHGVVLKLASSVFMKRIRSLVYTDVIGGSDRWWTRPDADQGRPEAADAPRRRRWIANLVYELEDAKEPAPGLEEPSASLRESVARAAAMPTSLWFDDESQLRSLVASGQAAACFNLIDHIVKRHGTDPDSYPDRVKEDWGRLVEDWRTFNEQPEAMLPPRRSARESPPAA